MALTEIGRWNLGALPYLPAMKTEGVLIYTGDGAAIRKAVYGVSDAALGTVLNPGPTAQPYYGTANIFGDYYFPPFTNTPYAVPWISAIHIGTGALSQFVSTFSNWGGYQRTMINLPASNRVFQASLSAGGGSPGSCSTLSGDVPLTASNTWGSGALGADMSNNMPFTPEGIDIGGTEYAYVFSNRVTVDAGANYLRAYEFRWNGANVIVSWLARWIYHNLNKGNTGAILSPISWPSPMQRTQDKLYYLMASSADGTLYMVEQLISDLHTATPYQNANFYATTLGNQAFGENTGFAASFHINAQYGKVYTINPVAIGTGGFPRPNNLYHAKLPWVGAQMQVLPDAGTTNAWITGIWTFPPYVYITKKAGITYGNQLIKFYDPDLGPRRHRRRHFGGELWDVIPEVAPYLG